MTSETVRATLSHVWEVLESFDVRYLHCWLARLNLTAEFQEVWREASPDRPCPV